MKFRFATIAAVAASLSLALTACAQTPQGTTGATELLKEGAFAPEKVKTEAFKPGTSALERFYTNNDLGGAARFNNDNGNPGSFLELPVAQGGTWVLLALDAPATKKSWKISFDFRNPGNWDTAQLRVFGVKTDKPLTTGYAGTLDKEAADELSSASLSENPAWTPKSISVDIPSGLYKAIALIWFANAKETAAGLDNVVVRSEEPRPVVPTTLALQPTLYQEIKGWGLYPTGYRRSDWGPEFHIIDKPNIQKAVFADLDYSHMRVDLQPNFYDGAQPDSINKTTIADMVEHLKIAQAHGKKRWIMSLWSPPPGFKTPEVTWGVTKKDDKGNATEISRFNPAKKAEFVRYIVNALRYLKAQGVGTPEVVSIQNEPDYPTWYDSLGYAFFTEKVKVDDRAVYQDIVKTLRKELDAAGLKSVLIGGSEAGSLHNQKLLLGEEFADLEKDVELRDALGAIQVHSYDEWADKDADFKAIISHNKPFTQWKKSLWQTEYSPFLLPRQNELSATLNTFTHLANDLTGVRFEYWFFWTGYSYSKEGKSDPQSLMWASDPTKPHKNKLYFAFQKLWQHVPAGEGWKVQRFESNDPDLITFYDENLKKHPANHPSGNGKPLRPVHALSFTNGKRNVFYLVNDMNTEKTVQLRNLPATSYKLLRTSASEDMDDLGVQPASNNQLPVVLPPQSLTLFLSQ